MAVFLEAVLNGFGLSPFRADPKSGLGRGTESRYEDVLLLGYY